MAQYIPKDALLAKMEKGVKLLLENNDRLYDEYGNYFYKNAENDYRFYHKLDEYIWDEDRMTLTDITKYLFHFNILEVKEVDIKKEIEKELEVQWNGEYLNTKKFRESAKHFFELGLAQKKKIDES